MTMNRETKRTRLQEAGYVSVRVGNTPGWVPAAYAARVEAKVAEHAEAVERVLAEPARPVGYPKGRKRKG